jgi:hypothetical protein
MEAERSLGQRKEPLVIVEVGTVRAKFHYRGERSEAPGLGHHLGEKVGHLHRGQK